MVPESLKIVAVEAKNLHCLGEGLSEEMHRRLPAIMAATNGVLKAAARSKGRGANPRF
jgi:hypothetical protein